MNESRIRTVLVVHKESELRTRGLSGWLGSFSDLAGIVLLCETGKQKRRRIKREMQRVGMLRFLFDVVPMRFYHKWFLKTADDRWIKQTLERIERDYGDGFTNANICRVKSVNSGKARKFISGCKPDLLLAVCNQLLKKETLSIPKHGSFTLHYGICPQYRNSFGGFWALANDDLDNVGTTLLQLDEGIDTGPVYGFYRAPLDETDSYYVIQHKTIFENLDAIRDKLLEVCSGTSKPIPTEGHPSATWGQPWFTKYLKWKRHARKRRKMHASSL